MRKLLYTFALFNFSDFTAIEWTDLVHPHLLQFRNDDVVEKELMIRGVVETN
jgi:hypothetical protein